MVKKWAATVRIDLEFRGLWGILRRSNMIQGLTEMVALRGKGLGFSLKEAYSLRSKSIILTLIDNHTKIQSKSK